MLGLESRAWTGDAPSLSQSRMPGGRLLPVRVLLFGLTVPLLLRLKLESLALWMEPNSPPPPHGGRAEAEALVRRIDLWLRAGRPLVRSGCLTRGLTLYWFLRRAGFPVSLRFGIGEMGETEDRLDGHCWLALEGEPLAERRDPRPLYTETWRIPSDNREPV
jgi:Transglutaminase-like superfamily